MRLELWPLAELGTVEPLMSVAEIESYSPHIVAEIDDETSIDDAATIPGGFEAWCRRQRRAERAAADNVFTSQ